MNRRSALIIVAFALPVVALASYSYMHPNVPSAAPKVAPNRKIANNNQIQYPTLQQVQAQVKARLVQLNKMTPEQWAELRKKRPHITLTLEQARENTKKASEQLDKMTPEQWDALHHPKGTNVTPPGKTPLMTPKPNAPTNTSPKQSDPYYPPPASGAGK